MTSSFLSDFVEKILSLGEIRTKEIDGRIYSEERLGCLHAPENTPPAELQFKTLLGLTGYLTENIDAVSHGLNDGVFLHVFDFNQVDLHGNLKPEADNRRFQYAQANLHAESFRFGQWYDLETFIIAIQSMFVADESTEALLSVIGHLANEVIVEHKDEGFGQSVQVKTGITTKSQVKIVNPMTLRPYRTFREVEQPESQFIFRLRKKESMQCALFEADGGKWKLDAITNIKRWLEDKLSTCPTDLHKAIVIG